jgi:integral membrane protein
MNPKKILLTVGWIEGISTIFLFCIAMPLKYGFDQPQVVSVAGQIHGGLFVLLVALLFIFRSTLGMSWGLLTKCLIGSVPPFGIFFYHRDIANLPSSTATDVDEAGDPSTAH